MKLFYIVCVLLISSITLNAQFNDFKAKAGLTKANDIAAAEIDNSMLVGIGAVNFPKMIPDSPLDLSFNDATGSSKMWVYFYANSENETETASIPIINTLLGYSDLRTLAGEIDLGETDFPFIKLENDFMDSDVFMSTVAFSSAYLNLKTKYAGSEYTLAGLTTNTEAEVGVVNDPYWAISFTNIDEEDSFDCYMNAKTGEVICQDADNTPQSVKYTMNSELKVYPQPANEEIVVNVNNKYNSYKVIDVFGNEMNLNSQFLLNGDLLNLDISNLSSGVYFLVLENPNTKDVVKFVKD